jgi:4-amino-4-deoxy-L-arabinose transferase-like glycosyltransferase
MIRIYQKNKVLFGCLFLGILLRIAYLYFYGIGIFPDTNSYISGAKELVDQLSLRNLSYRPPVYPFLLGVFTEKITFPAIAGEYWNIIILQNFIGVFCIFIFYLLAKELVKTKSIVYIAVVFFTIDPHFISFNAMVIAETWHYFWMMLFTYFTVLYFKRNYTIWYLIIGAFFLTLAVLTRQKDMFYPVLLALAFFWMLRNRKFKKNFRDFGIFILVFTLPIITVCQWSYTQRGYFGLTNAGEYLSAMDYGKGGTKSQYIALSSNLLKTFSENPGETIVKIVFYTGVLFGEGHHSVSKKLVDIYGKEYYDRSRNSFFLDFRTGHYGMFFAKVFLKWFPFMVFWIPFSVCIFFFNKNARNHLFSIKCNSLFFSQIFYYWVVAIVFAVIQFKIFPHSNIGRWRLNIEPFLILYISISIYSLFETFSQKRNGSMKLSPEC